MSQSEQNSTANKRQDRQGDVLLALAARSGDEHAFVELSKPHVKRISLTLYRITKNWQDAEDVLQEALIKAFQHIDSYQGKASFSTWFTSIAVNTALMLLRKQRGAQRIAIDHVGEAGTFREWEFKDPRDNPEQFFEKQQRAELIRSSILRLPLNLRKVIELQQSRDFSNQEIAQCLGISLAATKSRLLRARVALRAYVRRDVGKSPASVGILLAKQPAFPQNSDDDIKANTTRRKTKNRNSPDLIEPSIVPLGLMKPQWNETIYLGDDAELSIVGGRGGIHSR
jgi:RNA polymerase sigma-70 factor, ECF subfamily